ncbi:MAG TPA: hypothetical protein ENN46_03465 [Candidatus Woesearchaeota archaeon]|nr:hypothetical protein [Candidatus Woesearchaeota archaeon]
MIRVVQNRNPEWYSELYWSENWFRRDLSVKALERIIKQQDKPFSVRPFRYDAIYRELIREHLIYGFYYQHLILPPNDKVRDFFGFYSLKKESKIKSFI